jgi:hypothetical protein
VRSAKTQHHFTCQKNIQSPFLRSTYSNNDPLYKKDMPDFSSSCGIGPERFETFRSHRTSTASHLDWDHITRSHDTNGSEVRQAARSGYDDMFVLRRERTHALPRLSQNSSDHGTSFTCSENVFDTRTPQPNDGLATVCSREKEPLSLLTHANGVGDTNLNRFSFLSPTVVQMHRDADFQPLFHPDKTTRSHFAFPSQQKPTEAPFGSAFVMKSMHGYANDENLPDSRIDGKIREAASPMGSTLVKFSGLLINRGKCVLFLVRDLVSSVAMVFS